MKSIISLNYFSKITSGSIHDANSLGNFTFHMSNMLSPIQSIVYVYTKIFETVSFLKTAIIHCNINMVWYGNSLFDTTYKYTHLNILHN